MSAQASRTSNMVFLPQAAAMASLAIATGYSGAALAQDAEPEIVVLGRGLAQTPGVPAYDVVTISRERLANDASGRLEDVLGDIAGFQQFRRVDSRAANPTSQGVTLRTLGGNAASRALMLVDGVPVADPFTGYIPFSAIDPGRLSSARITRGGGAGPFGSGAVAGTIELSSAGIDELPLFSADAFYGSRDATELTGRVAAPLGAGFVTVGGGWQRGDGYILTPSDQRGTIDVPSRYSSWNLAARAVAPLSASSELQASVSGFDDHRRRGLPGANIGTNGVDASIRLISRGSWGVDALAYIQTRQFSATTVVANATRTSASTSLDQYSTPAIGIGGKIELRPPVGGAHVLRIGVDARYAKGATHELSSYVAGAPTRNRIAGGNSLVTGGFIEDDWTIGKLVLTAGARIDHWTIRDGHLDERRIATGATTQALSFPDRSGWRASARGGALFHASPMIDIRAAAYTGFRLPTLNELYRPFRVGADATIANPGLKLEELTGYEAGIDLRPLSGVRIGLTAFHNRLKNAIGNVTIGQGPGTFPQVGFVTGAVRQRQNLDAISVDGIEASGEARLGAFALLASYAFSDPEVKSRQSSPALDRLRPAQSPRHAASATLSYAPRQGPRLSATLRYVAQQFEDDLNRRVIPDALTVDAVAALTLSHGVTVTARGENLFDEKIVSGISTAGIEDLGTPRTVWIGVAFAFGGKCSRR